MNNCVGFSQALSPEDYQKKLDEAVVSLIFNNSRYSFSVVRLNNNNININKPIEFEAFTDRALLFVANLVCYFVPH